MLKFLEISFWLLIVFLGGGACGVFVGRWIEKRRRAGKSYEEIVSEAKSKVT
jgi:hypothetical protein